METDCFGYIHVVMRGDGAGNFSVDSVWTGRDGSAKSQARLYQLEGLKPYGKHYGVAVKPDCAPHKVPQQG